MEDAIEKHLKDETLQEHLEDVLDELCNQLPEREYERISAEIYAEDVAEREEEEAARTYAAYHVTERTGVVLQDLPVRSCWMPAKSCAAIHRREQWCCTGSVHQNVFRRATHHSRGVQRAHRPSHGEHRQKMRGVFDPQLRQARILRRTHHGRLVDMGDAGCVSGGVPCHTVAIRVER